jgi:hypothetical protein
MQATVRYKLSADGQRAALAAGLPASSEQTMQVEAQPEDLPLFAVHQDGSLSADARDGAIRRYGSAWDEHRFDVPPTAADLGAFLRERRAGRAEVEAAEQAERDRKAAEETAERERRRQRLIDAVAMANAAGETAVPGHRVGAHQVESTDYNGLRITEEESPEVAALCARKRAADEAAGARSKRISALPDMPFDLPVVATSEGYTVPVPPARFGDAWAKVISNVDPSKRGGYALEGAWMRGAASLPSGAVIVVGSKEWQGSRRSGSYVHNARVYVVTPAGVIRAWSGEDATGVCAKLLAETEGERVAGAITDRIATCDKHLATLAALDRTEYAGEMDVVSERTVAWQALRDRLQAALEGGAGDDRILDVDSAAEVIVATGYRALAKEFHPDHGGSPETMALINEARRQLRELLKLAGSVRK